MGGGGARRCVLAEVPTQRAMAAWARFGQRAASALATAGVECTGRLAASALTMAGSAPAPVERRQRGFSGRAACSNNAQWLSLDVLPATCMRSRGGGMVVVWV
jgi:hypothetical protein